MLVSMKNPKIGEIKEVKVGFSWILFLFSGFFGLPLFLRKLYVWGGVFLALWVVNVILGIVAEESESAAIIYLFLQFVYSYYNLSFVRQGKVKLYEFHVI